MQSQLPASGFKLSDVAAILGMVLGTAGSVMSLMNYLRERPKVRVFLKWDMEVAGNPTAPKIGIVRVTNVGRRPVYISVVTLKLPRGLKYDHLILKQSMTGTKLSEGDAPATFLINYTGLTRYAKHWRRVRAYAEDSAGRRYLSKKLSTSEIPSWAK